MNQKFKNLYTYYRDKKFSSIYGDPVDKDVFERIVQSNQFNPFISGKPFCLLYFLNKYKRSILPAGPTLVKVK